MNVFNRFSLYIIEKSFKFSVAVIEHFSNMTPLDDKLNELRKLPKNTIGKEIANCLDENKLRLVAGYESHDLKHIVLQYKMTPLDEIRMQAFMLGNGNYTLPCFAILIFGMILLPSKLLVFLNDFKKGRNSVAISSWLIEDYKYYNCKSLQQSINEESIKKASGISMIAITKFIVFTIMGMGIAGMLFCLPYLFSASLTDLVGAGFPFLGGSILVAGSLVALSNISGRYNYQK